MAGLQAAQELPGFLLHEELVPGPPAGHHLPGTGHLGGGKKVTIQAGTARPQGILVEVSLVGGVGAVSMTLPQEANLLALSNFPGKSLLPLGPQDMTTPLCGTSFHVRKTWSHADGEEGFTHADLYPREQPGQPLSSRTARC